MGRFYSPTGNIEVWAEKPEGYLTEDEWMELHPPVQYVPTKEEQLTSLDEQFWQEKSELLNYFTDALLNNDAEAQAACREEMRTLEEQYDADHQAISDEE